MLSMRAFGGIVGKPSFIMYDILVCVELTYVARTRVRELGAGVNLDVRHFKLKNKGCVVMDPDVDTGTRMSQIIYFFKLHIV